MEKYCRAGQATADIIRRVRIASRLKNARIQTCSLYLLHVAFPLRQWLHERATILHVHCLSFYNGRGRKIGSGAVGVHFPKYFLFLYSSFALSFFIFRLLLPFDPPYFSLLILFFSFFHIFPVYLYSGTFTVQCRSCADV